MKQPLLFSACLALVFLTSACSRSAAQDDTLDIRKVLAEMESKGHGFDSAPLHRHGRKGLAPLLDALFPESAGNEEPTLSEKEVRDLLKSLKDDSGRVREAAMQKLIRSGRSHRGLVEAATKDNDPDVRLRAFAVLRAWQPSAVDRSEMYLAGFEGYAKGIKDRERLDYLAQRMVKALDAGMPEGARHVLVRTALRPVAASCDDRRSKVFEPLLKHRDVRVPVLVIRALGSHGQGNSYFPQFLLDAMTSVRKEVVRAALDSGPSPCWDEKKAPELRRRLTRIFKGDDEELKFRVSFTLMHTFGDRDAFRYLLTQVKSKDQERAFSAIAWVGDACHYGKKITPEILDALAPLLRSADDQLRRCAALALATYQGEEVVKALIPMLGDRVALTVEETSGRLLDQRDKTMLRRLLRQAAEKHENAMVRAKAKEVLGKVTEN